MKGLEMLRKIDVDAVAVGDYVQGVRSRLLYRVISVKVNEVTIQRVDDPENVQTLIKLALYNKFRVAEAPVAVEPEVGPNDTENQVEATPVTTISTEPKTVQVKVSTEPKKGGKQKIDNETYIQIAENFLKGVYKTKKEVAEKYSVDPATISDMLSDKYVRKSCKEAISALKIKYGYSK